MGLSIGYCDVKRRTVHPFVDIGSIDADVCSHFVMIIVAPKSVSLPEIKSKIVYHYFMLCICFNTIAKNFNLRKYFFKRM